MMALLEYVDCIGLCITIYPPQSGPLPVVGMVRTIESGTGQLNVLERGPDRRSEVIFSGRAVSSSRLEDGVLSRSGLSHVINVDNPLHTYVRKHPSCIDGSDPGLGRPAVSYSARGMADRTVVGHRTNDRADRHTVDSHPSVSVVTRPSGPPVYILLSRKRIVI